MTTGASIARLHPSRKLAVSQLHCFGLVTSPTGRLISQQQLSGRCPADLIERCRFGTRLAFLMPPVAVLLYPFVLEAFHAGIAPGDQR